MSLPLVVVLAVGALQTQQTCVAGTPRDSAGVRIVSNAPATNTTSTIAITRTPSLILGDEMGADAAETFGSVAGALRLANREIVVADVMARTLQVFAPDGRPTRTIGRAGEGPGEFQSLFHLTKLRGDTIMVWDFRRWRALSYTSTGTFASAVNFQTVTYPISPRGSGAPPDSASDVPQFPHYVGAGFFIGRLSISASQDARSTGAESRAATAPPAGAQRGSRRVALVGFRPRSGGPTDITPASTLIGVFQQQTYVYRSADGWLRNGPLPFAPGPQTAAGEGRIYSGDGASYSIQVNDSSGKLIQIVRLCRGDVQLTRGMIDRFARAEIERTPSAGMRTEEVMRAMPWPTTVAQFGALHVDAAGNLWSGDYPVPGEDQRWSIFGRDGLLIATAITPAGLVVFDVGRDYILGKRADTNGRETVELHTMTLRR